MNQIEEDACRFIQQWNDTEINSVDDWAENVGWSKYFNMTTTKWECVRRAKESVMELIGLIEKHARLGGGGPGES